MLNKLIHFIKYNNATILIAVAFLIVGSSVMASETGRAAIGNKQTSIEGVDNTLLLEADLERFDMEFKIERIEADEEMYYVTYTYLDLDRSNNVWQYQLKEDVRRVSRKENEDLGLYLAEELKEEYEARIKELKEEKAKAEKSGPEKRVEVTEYSGLIGKALNATSKVFPGYEPLKKRELASPLTSPALRAPFSYQGEELSQTDDLTAVYLEYIEENDPDEDNIFGASDNCPAIYNPDQLDSDEDGIGDECDIDDMDMSGITGGGDEEPAAIIEEPETVEIIKLPDAGEGDEEGEAGESSSAPDGAPSSAEATEGEPADKGSEEVGDENTGDVQGTDPDGSEEEVNEPVGGESEGD